MSDSDNLPFGVKFVINLIRFLFKQHEDRIREETRQREQEIAKLEAEQAALIGRMEEALATRQQQVSSLETLIQRESTKQAEMTRQLGELQDANRKGQERLDAKLTAIQSSSVDDSLNLDFGTKPRKD